MNAMILYLDADFPGSAIDHATTGVTVYAAVADSKGGDTMLVVDINHDGFAEMLYSVPNTDVNDRGDVIRLNTGLLAILRGHNDVFSTTEGFIHFAEPPENLQVDFYLVQTLLICLHRA